MKILIDNGHGRETAGKRSPDGLLQEWQYTRQLAQRIVCELRLRGHDAEALTPEVADTPLADRVRRVQQWCKEYGSTQVLLVSLHLNAAGDGSRWMTANGLGSLYHPGRYRCRPAGHLPLRSRGSRIRRPHSRAPTAHRHYRRRC